MEADWAVGGGEFERERVASPAQWEFDDIAREKAAPILVALGDRLSVEPETVASVGGDADANRLGFEHLESSRGKGDGALGGDEPLAEIDVTRLGIAAELLPSNRDHGAGVDGVSAEALLGGSGPAQAIVA